MPTPRPRTQSQARALALTLCLTAACTSDRASAPAPNGGPTPTWQPELVLASLSFLDVSGTSPTDVFALARDHFFLHYDGTTWSPMLRPETADEPEAIWAFAPDDVHAVGSGVHFHYDGTRWSVTTEPDLFVNVVWGADGELFAGYNNGRVFHYDGTAWSEMTTPFGTSEHIYGIGGGGTDNVWVAGRFGLLGHWNGSQWTAIETDTDVWLRDVWVAGPEDAFAVGDDGTVVRVENGTFATKTTITTADLDAVWGTSVNGVFAGGDDVVFRFDGTSWTDLGASHHTAAFWGIAGNDVLAAGADGIWRYDGAGWTTEWADVESGALYAVDGTERPYFGGYALYRLDDDALHEFPWDTGTQGTLRALHAFADDDIWGVGFGGVAVHFDGASWTLRDFGTDVWLDDLWGESTDLFYVAGDDGVILRVESGLATPMTTPTTASLTAIGGAGETIFALGNDGVILRLVAGEWVDLVSPTVEHIADILAFSETDMVAVATGGVVLHWDGTSWTAIPSGIDASFRAVWGTSRANLFVASSQGTMHFDGSMWTALPRYTDISLYAIWGSPDGDEVVVAGSPRLITRYRLR